MSASAYMPNFLGSVVDGRYELTELLGSGTYGVVYSAIDRKAEWTADGRVALKIMHKTLRTLGALRKEMACHTKMSAHAHVLTLHDAFEDARYMYLVLDLCAGDLFAQITDRRAFYGDDARVRRVFLQIVDAVAACHKAKVYHRDLKPENILTSADGERVFLCDFGLATERVISTEFGVGTSTYMSPECIGASGNNVPYCSSLNDVWALGVILINMLSGRHPWSRAVREDACYARFVREPGFLLDMLPISRGANALLRRVLTPSPLGRLTLPRLRAAVERLDTFFVSAAELEGASEYVRVAHAAAVGHRAMQPGRLAGVPRAPQPAEEEEERVASTVPEAVEREVSSAPGTAADISESSDESAGPITPEATVPDGVFIIGDDEDEIQEVECEPVKSIAPAALPDVDLVVAVAV